MNRTNEFMQDIEKGIYNETRLYEIIDFEPQNLQYFVTTFIEKIDSDSYILETALSYLNEESFVEVIDFCVKLLKTKKSNSAECVIAHASLQFPHLLHKYAEELFVIKPNKSKYYSNWFFRDLKSFEFLKSELKIPRLSFWGKFTKKIDYDFYFYIFTSLLEIRSEEAIKLAIIFARKILLFKHLKPFKEQPSDKVMRAFVNDVGFDFEGGNVFKLNNKTKMWHFTFENGYFDSIRKDFKHPTWSNFDTEYIFEFDFGGVIQKNDESKLFHVMTIEPVPHNFGISLKKLTLGFEFEYYEKAFYKHDENGFPHFIKTHELGKKMEVDEILPTKIRLSETPKRWHYQDWGLSNGENLNRFGGEPTWIQGAYYPTCPETGETMQFLFQIDNVPSIGPFQFGGGGGIFYFFWCDTSKISTYGYQQT